MKQRFLLMSFISLLAMLGFVISNVNATGGIAAYYVNPGGTYDAMLDGRVRRIVNNTAYTIFIPSRTLTEQQSFINNLPTGVTMIVDVCDFATTVTIDGASYPIQAFGSQCWMTKNLNYATGTSYCYDNNAANCTTYGRLYTWATETVNACPTGWHLPSDAEYTILEGTIGSTAAAWTNPSGWAGLYGGYRYTDGSFYYVGSNARFWSSSEGGAGAWSRYLNPSYSTVYRYAYPKAYGLSVRCLKN